MNSENKNKGMLYRVSPAVSELNKVPGFDPLKLLRRTVSGKTKQPVLRLDLPYKKLWFRLANPHGRIRVNALRVTEQMAVYEAQVYLDQKDPQPLVAFTASCTRDAAPDGHYIEAAQWEAINEALTDAGFGLQFADVEARPQDRMYGSDLPLDATANQKAAPMVPAEKAAAPAEPVLAAKPAAPIVTPEPAKPVQAEEPAMPVPEQAPAMPVETPAPAQAAQTLTETPVAEPTAAKPYTETSPVEEILQYLTLEQAMEYVVDYGSCKGWTMREVSEKRPASLKFYVFGGYKGENNLLRATAKLVLESLTGQKQVA